MILLYIILFHHIVNINDNHINDNHINHSHINDNHINDKQRDVIISNFYIIIHDIILSRG
jgi:hypothetical protein